MGLADEISKRLKQAVRSNAGREPMTVIGDFVGVAINEIAEIASHVDILEAQVDLLKARD